MAGDTTASVTFTPGALGTGSLFSYTADCGGIQATGNNAPITVAGLTNGTAYTCKVMTTSGVGPSPWSALSASSICPQYGKAFSQALLGSELHCLAA